MSRAPAKEVVRFFVVACGLAWLLWLPLILSRTGLGWLPFRVPMPWIIPGTFAPTAAAIWLHWRESGNFRAVAWCPSWTRALLGLVAGTVMIAAAFVVAPGWWLAGGSALAWPALLSYPAAAARAITMAGPLGEEAGWRGYALPRLQQRWGPVIGSLWLGLGWAGWHLPLFLIPGYGGGSFPMYLAMVCGLSFAMTTATNLARGSVITAILLHGVFNGSSAVLGGFLATAQLRPGAQPLTVIVTSFWCLALGLVLLTRGRLGQQTPRAITST